MDELAGSDPVAHSGKTRDFRIDFFRGLALYMILVDHIAFNPLTMFTYQRFGFSDAAEIFVFLSGLSCGIVYYSVLIHRGRIALLGALIKRAGLIYAFYLAASGAIILLVASTADLIINTGVLNRRFVGCVESIFDALWSAALLSSQPSLPSILVLYMALTIWVFPVLLIGVRIHPALILAVSGSIWAISQLYKPALGQINGFPYFQSAGMAVLVLDRAVPRDKISKAREPAMEAAQVATGDRCLDRGCRVAQSPAKLHRKQHCL